MNHFKEILISIDQFVNTLLGGWADETLSARSWRTNSMFRPIIDKIMFFDPNHCQTSYEAEKLRMHSPPEAR
jgi:hypothetical protein